MSFYSFDDICNSKNGAKFEYMLEIDLKINEENEIDLWPDDLNWQNRK